MLRRALALLVAAVVASGCATATTDELADRYREPDLDNIIPPSTSTSDASGPDSTDRDTDDGDTDGPDTGTNTDGRDDDHPTPTWPPATDPLPVEDRDCPFDTTGLDVDCGSIEIPATAPTDPVRITFARFRSTSPDPAPDPVVYLHGGPGGAMLAHADQFVPVVVDPFIGERDVILYDQRGAGESSPLPICAEAYALDDAFFAEQRPHTEIETPYLAAIDRCGTRVERDDSIDLSTYNSATHADDLLLLLHALGIEQVNLHGVSYGTRLAQTILRDHPDPVRSVILSGVYPTDENLIGAVPETFRSALDVVFAACASDTRCDDALPDPWASLTDLVDQFDNDPFRITFALDETTAFPGLVDGDDLIGLLHSLLYTADGAALIPDLLIDLELGEGARMERVGQDGLFDTGDVLAYMAVQCHEEAPFTTASELAAGSTTAELWDRISLVPGLIGSSLVEACTAIPSAGQGGPLEDEPVTWDQPTIVFSGAFDPITPPWWAESLASRLPDATLLHFSDRGHDSDEGPCAASLLTAFVHDPAASLDTSCIDPNAQLAVNDNASTMTDPFDARLVDSSFDIDPSDGEQWIDIRLPDWPADFYAVEDAYRRELDVYDNTVVVVRSGPWAPDEVTWYFPDEAFDEFVPSSPPSDLSRWQRLTYDALRVDAVSYVIDEPDLQLNISLVAHGDEIDRLENDVLLPIVRSAQLP